MQNKSITSQFAAFVWIIMSFVVVSCTTNDTNLFANTQMSELAQSIVLVESFDDNRIPIGSGSGTIIDSYGYILTAFHVIGDPETGVLHNPDGITRISVTDDYHNAPEFRYYAQVVEYNQDADLAVLRIIRLKSGATPNECLDLPALAINTDEMQIGDVVYALGYPTLGGKTITATAGQIAGYDYVVDNQGKRDVTASLKIDAMLAPGISGGALINQDYQLVGVPTQRIIEIAGQVGFVKPVSLLNNMVANAMMNDIPGCDGAAPVQLQREPATFPTHYVIGQVKHTWWPFTYGAIFLFDSSVDVSVLDEQEVRRATTYRRFGSDGVFAIPLTDKIAIEEKYGVVLVIEGKTVLRLNNQQLTVISDVVSGYSIKFK